MIQVVHPAPGNATGTLVNGILNHCSLPEASFPNQGIIDEAEDVSDGELNSISTGIHEASVRPGIVHRLDKGTSGLLVVAKVFSPSNPPNLPTTTRTQERYPRNDPLRAKLRVIIIGQLTSSMQLMVETY